MILKLSTFILLFSFDVYVFNCIQECCAVWLEPKEAKVQGWHLFLNKATKYPVCARRRRLSFRFPALTLLSCFLVLLFSVGAMDILVLSPAKTC